MLSRATLKFSFNSPNNISLQNILVWVQKFVWSNQIFGRKKMWSQKFDPDEIVGPHFFESKQFWVQTKFGPKNLIRMKLLVQHLFESKFFLGPNKFGSEKSWSRKCCVPKFFCFLKCFLVHKKVR